MLPLIVRMVAPVLVVMAYLLLIHRLKAATPDKPLVQPSRLWGGFAILLAAALWYVVMGFSEYDVWFIPRAYIFIQSIWLTVSAISVFMIVLGVADLLRRQREEADEFRNQHRGSGILTAIQRTARQPFSITELMSVTLEEIRIGIPGMCGAVYLYNRARRELVLTVSHGLKRDESAYLERLTSDTNPLFQALTLEESLIGGALTFVGADGDETISRFKCSLSIPLVSGQEKLGGVILFSERERAFDKGTLAALEPICGWLGERIRVTRLAREVKQAQNSALSAGVQSESTLERVSAFSQSLITENPIESFCRSLKGIAGAESIYLIGLTSGALTIRGGSDVGEEFSDNYRSALVNAFDRNKPLIINQEGSADDGETRVVLSSLVYPIRQPGRREAILLRKSDSAFAVSDIDLRLLGLASLIGAAAVTQGEQETLSLARRRGFDKVISFLRWESQNPIENDPRYFERQLKDILPSTAILATFVKDGDYYRPSGDIGEFDRDLLVGSHDGMIGKAIANSECRAVSGTTAVSRTLQGFGSGFRDAIGRACGQRGTPSMLAICPLAEPGGVPALTLVILHDISDNEAGEWERLLSLAVALFRLSQTMVRMNRQKIGDSMNPATINEINNHLTGVIGQAELLLTSPSVAQSHRQALEGIIREAQAAAQGVRSDKTADSQSQIQKSPSTDASLNGALNNLLKSTRISEGLYMIGGRPREIELFLSPDAGLAMIEDSARHIARELVERISAASIDEEIVSIASYQREQYVYFDFVRRRRHSQTAEPIANVGQYSPAADVLKYRPEDSYLRMAAEAEAQIAFDRQSPQPVYLSLRFPLKQTPEVRTSRMPRLLAIDDQPIILDLITAMCQSMGFDVQTAVSGEEGIRLAMTQRFDAVMTDLSMPGMSGLDVARSLRSSRPNLPVVLVTGWDTGLSQAELADAGVREVVYKPFRIEQLTEVLRTVTSGAFSK
ncbi:MAG: response regulator [Candidatus Zixiibacteriota bacterium]